MSTRNGPGDFAAEVSAEARDGLGRIRRMPITRSSGATWQVRGHTLLDKTVETRDAPPFTGIGFASRPPADGNPEAIVLYVGGPGGPVIVAARDEKTRQAVFKTEDELAPGEAALFSPTTIIRIMADGTVEIRSIGGVAAELATKADLERLKDAIDNNAGAGIGFGAGLAADLGIPPTWPAGTTVLKAE